MGIPLYVRIKDVQSPPTGVSSHVVQTSSTSIEFGSREYHFDQVFTSEIDYHPYLQDANDSVTVFVGPTGSGKTTCLRHMLDATLKFWQQKPWSSKKVSAFEIKDNRHVIDLTEEKKAPKPLKQVGSIQLSDLDHAQYTFKSILASRTTAQTATNRESSRSCLVLKIADSSSTTTYVDMMGNEKFDKGTANQFANSTMSSLTQYLKSNGSGGRSANTIINIIFGEPKAKISVVLALDPCGDPRLIKSSLLNIADLTRQCQPELARESVTTAAPKLLPHYAKPTISSLSPKKASTPQWSTGRVTKPVKRPTIARKIVNTLSRTLYGRGAEQNRQKIEKLEEEKRHMDTYIQELTSSKDRLLEEIAALEESRTQLIEDLHQSQTLIEKNEAEKKAQVSDLRVCLENARSTHGQLQDSINGLKSQVGTMETSMNAAVQKGNEAEAKSKELTAVKEHLESRISALTSRIESLEASQEQKTKEIEDLERELSTKLDMINELKSNLELKVDTITKLEAELGSKLDSITDLESKLNSKIDTMKGFESQLEEMSSLRTTVEEQKKLLTEKAATVASLKSRIDNQDNIIGEKAETIAELKLQMTSFGAQTSKLSNQEATLAEKTTTIANLKSQIERLEEENDRLNKKDDLLSERNETIKFLESKIEQLEKELHGNGQKSEAIDNLNLQIDELKTQLSKSQQDHEKTLSSKKELKTRISTMTDEIRDLKRKLEGETTVDKENQPTAFVPPQGTIIKKKFSGDDIFADQQNKESVPEPSQEKKRKKLGNIDNYRSAMLEMSAKKHKKKNKPLKLRA